MPQSVRDQFERQEYVVRDVVLGPQTEGRRRHEPKARVVPGMTKHDDGPVRDVHTRKLREVRVLERRGRIEERKVKSAVLRNPVLGDERPTWIYTPPDFDRSAGPYPLLVLLDGAVYVSSRFINAPATLDNLINEGRMRAAIVVFDMGNRGGGPEGRARSGEALVQGTHADCSTKPT